MPLYNFNAVVRLEAKDRKSALLEVARAVESLADGKKKPDGEYDFIDINITGFEDPHDNARLS